MDSTIANWSSYSPANVTTLEPVFTYSSYWRDHEEAPSDNWSLVSLESADPTTNSNANQPADVYNSTFTTPLQPLWSSFSETMHLAVDSLALVNDCYVDEVTFAQMQASVAAFNVLSTEQTTSPSTSEDSKPIENAPTFKCQWKHCGQVFSRKISLSSHMRHHTRQGAYKCQFCNCSFVYPTRYAKHVNEHIRAGDKKVVSVPEEKEPKKRRGRPPKVVHSVQTVGVSILASDSDSCSSKEDKQSRVDTQRGFPKASTPQYTPYTPAKCQLCDLVFFSSRDLSLHIEKHARTSGQSSPPTTSSGECQSPGTSVLPRSPATPPKLSESGKKRSAPLSKSDYPVKSIRILLPKKVKVVEPIEAKSSKKDKDPIPAKPASAKVVKTSKSKKNKVPLADKKTGTKTKPASTAPSDPPKRVTRARIVSYSQFF